MEFEDRSLVCRECGAPFIFTAQEQEFFQSRRLEHEPTRCPECRASRKGGRRPAKESAEIACAACGLVTEVPFKPSGGKPVYCRDCYPLRS